MYKILRVPPNKDSFARAYEYIVGNIPPHNGKSNLLNFDDFYNHIDTIYMIQNDNQEYVGIGTIGSVYYESELTILNGLCWNLSILTFDPDDGHDSQRYMKVYDLIFTIIRDKKDRPIILEGMDDKEQYKDITNALKNNKFRLHRGLKGPVWYLIHSRFDGLLQTYDRKINPHSDADVLDELAVFNDQPKTIIPDNNSSGMIPIEPPERLFCRHERCKGCEFLASCSPDDRCRFEQ